MIALRIGCGLAVGVAIWWAPSPARAWATVAPGDRPRPETGLGDELGGLAQLERAIHESAFADHFLQDAFAAGHMGFNRTASSAAAAKSFHDTWNGRGRVVSDRSGGRWVTFGDGRLDRPENQDGRRHVVDAATASVRGAAGRAHRLVRGGGPRVRVQRRGRRRDLTAVRRAARAGRRG